jgi:hypothetical protein
LTRFRLPVAMLALLALAAFLVACGGGSGGGGSSEDPQKVLDQTFSAKNEKVDSGNLDLKLKVDVSGDQSANVDAQLSGPFENEGTNKIPKLDLAVSASGSGSGQSFNVDAGLTSTGDAAFVNYKGTDYQVDQSLFDQFKQQVESAAGQQTQNQGSADALFKSLGIDDPKSLLTNLSNDGSADVQGTQTTHISGDVDVRKLIEGIKNLASGASALGALGGSSSNVPSGAELDQAANAVKTAHFDIYSGNDDHILRRLTITLGVEPPSGSTSKVDVSFDFVLGDVNQSQTIEAPSNPKPFSELLQSLGVPSSALGQLGSLGLGASGSGSSGSSGSSGAGSATSQQAQKYLQCVSQAASAADLQQCQSLAP